MRKYRYIFLIDYCSISLNSLSNLSATSLILSDACFS